jgi:hypothetical protein
MSAHDLARAELQHQRYEVIDAHTAASPAAGQDANDNHMDSSLDELVRFEAQLLLSFTALFLVAT